MKLRVAVNYACKRTHWDRRSMTPDWLVKTCAALQQDRVVTPMLLSLLNFSSSSKKDESGSSRCPTGRKVHVATLRSLLTFTIWLRQNSPASIRYTGVYHRLPTSSSQNRWKVGAGDIVSVLLRSS